MHIHLNPLFPYTLLSFHTTSSLTARMTLAALDLPVTTGEINFAKPGSWPANERPYTLLYEPVTDEKLSNFQITDTQPVPIRDMRPKKGSLSLDKEGFLFADFKSKMAYEDYLDDEKLKTVLAREVRELLLEKLGAKAAFIHECVVSFPPPHILCILATPADLLPSPCQVPSSWHGGCW